MLTCAFGDFRFEQLKKECHFRNVIIPMLFATQTKEDEGERAIRIEKRLNVQRRQVIAIGISHNKKPFSAMIYFVFSICAKSIFFFGLLIICKLIVLVD